MQALLLAMSFLTLNLYPGQVAQTGQATQNQSMRVVATGEGSGGSSMSQEQIKQIALADAKRMALEQAGTIIFSETEVNNLELTKDQIHAFAQGLVKVLKVSENTCLYDDKIKAMYCRVSIEAEVEVIEGKELFARLSQSRAQENKNAAQGELGFGFNILAFSPVGAGKQGIPIKDDSSQNYHHVELQENGVLHSGDEFQIHFTPQQDAYVYIINLDSRGQVYPMLPNPEAISNHHLQAGRRYVLPAQGKYYQLDHHTGTETIYLIVSRHPMPDIDFLIEKAQMNNQSTGDLLKATVGVRGLSGITQGPKTIYQLAQGISVQDLEEHIRGKGAIVRIFKYHHQ